MDKKENPALQCLIKEAIHKAKGSNNLSLGLNDPEIVQMLVMNSIDDINTFIMTFLIEAFNRSSVENFVSPEKLYLVPCEKSFEGWEYMLGEDILTPDISMPTVNQLYEFHAWRKNFSLKDRVRFKNFDTWVENNLEAVLEKAREYARKISLPITPFQDVLKEVGEKGNDLRTRLQIVAINRHIVLQNNVSTMKRTKAPEFLVCINTDEIIRIKKIIRNLGVVESG